FSPLLSLPSVFHLTSSVITSSTQLHPSSSSSALRGDGVGGAAAGEAGERGRRFEWRVQKAEGIAVMAVAPGVGELEPELKLVVTKCRTWQ
ncbi:hypothetical protein VIGAN_01528700, partial [Vigna angularis var. angularis]